MAAAASMGLYNGGVSRCDPAFGISYGLADVGVNVLTVVGTGGFGEVGELGEVGDELVTATGDGLDIAPAEKVRLIQKGEKVEDLIEEVNLAQYGERADGVEHNIVSLKNGERWIVKGGPDGTNWDNMADELNRIILHTHPDASYASPSDMRALAQLGQKSAWIKSIYYGKLIKYSL